MAVAAVKNFNVSVPTGNFIHVMDVYRPLDAIDDAHGSYPDLGLTGTPILNSIPCMFNPVKASQEDGLGRRTMIVEHQVYTATHIIDPSDGTELDRDWILTFNGRKFLVQIVLNQGELNLLWVITTKEFR